MFWSDIKDIPSSGIIVISCKDWAVEVTDNLPEIIIVL